MSPISSTSTGFAAATADLINTARHDLGAAYGLGRPLRRVELARLVGLGAAHVELLTKGRAALSGPVEVVIRMLLAGHRSPHHEEALRSRYCGGRQGSFTS